MLLTAIPEQINWPYDRRGGVSISLEILTFSASHSSFVEVLRYMTRQQIISSSTMHCASAHQISNRWDSSRSIQQKRRNDTTGNLMEPGKKLDDW
jgi:hypothetical protein